MTIEKDIDYYKASVERLNNAKAQLNYSNHLTNKCVRNIMGFVRK